LFTSFGGSEVVDLLPIPLRRVLNFRFVAFMASWRTLHSRFPLVRCSNTETRESQGAGLRLMSGLEAPKIKGPCTHHAELRPAMM
jgi:hypothetical protein